MSSNKEPLTGIITSKVNGLRDASATPTTGDTEGGRVRWESELEAELAMMQTPATERSARLELPSLFPEIAATANDDSPDKATTRLRFAEAEERGQESGELTPQDRHYLNRILVNLELQREMSALSQIGTLAKYGPPFAAHANGPNSKPAPATPTHQKSGFLGGLFGGGQKERKDHQFDGYKWDSATVEESPVYQYLFWRFIYNMPGLSSAKPSYWQEQIQPFFDSFAERDLSSTVERGEITKRRMLSLGVVRIIGTYYSTCLRPIQPSSPARPPASMKLKIDLVVPGGMESMWRRVAPEVEYSECKTWVAVAEEKGKGNDVSYRIVTRALAAPNRPLFAAVRSYTDCRSLASALTELDPKNRLDLPAFPTSSTSRACSRLSMQRYLRLLVICLSCPSRLGAKDPSLLTSARAELESFLLRDGVTPSSMALMALVTQCEDEETEADQRHERWIAIGQKSERLQAAWRSYRHKLIDGDELDRTMGYAKKSSKTTELPREHQEAVQWASIWFGQALHWIFVGAATGPEVFNILRSFHELIPYGPVKLGLSIVNPSLAIRAIVHLILGQPAGQLSLFQRIWSHICNAANKHQRKLIERFRKRIRNDSLCNALKAHVRAGYVQRQNTKQEAIRRNEDIVLTIIRERGSKGDFDLVQRWHDDFARAEADPRASSGSQSFADLKELLAAYYRYRDREQVLQIALEPNTPRLLHASIAVFYGAIHAVAKISNLPDRVADMQAFLDDLCRICLSDNTEPAEFIKLANRHYEKAYYFLHELASKGGSHLDPILDWARSGLGFIREGIPTDSTAGKGSRAGPDIDGLLASPHLSEKERADLLAEARKMAEWTVLKKARSDVYLRLDLLRADERISQNAADHDDHDGDWLDRTVLWQSFLEQFPPSEQERFAAAAATQAQEGRRTGPGGDLEWAWWAARETAGAAGKGIVKAHQESAADAVRKGSMDFQRTPSGAGGGGTSSPRAGSRKRSSDLGTRKKSFDRHNSNSNGNSGAEASRRKSQESRRFSLDTTRRHSGETSRRPSLDLRNNSSSSGQGQQGAAAEEVGLAVPPPEVEKTRESLLGRYMEGVKGYLTNARQKQVR
ncbi:hypothetical protein JCM10908_002410 [Rhodotorula pacifica]|uniref:uncharacterized protein n=1 Tax=Rhodotorula pacifica TaxID=1495444 RepID=UPI00317B4DB4